jgi:hypothetical protein
VDWQEAVGVVVGVEQRQLLPAVNRIAGVVDVQHDRGRLLREPVSPARFPAKLKASSVEIRV